MRKLARMIGLLALGGVAMTVMQLETMALLAWLLPVTPIGLLTT